MTRIEEMDLILPFYVNGTLGLSNRARIDDQLHHSSKLRAALIAEEEFAIQIRAMGSRKMTRHLNVEERLRAMRVKLGAVEKQCTDTGINRAACMNLKTQLRLLGPQHWHPAKFYD
jgi:hypothetical protein